MTPRAEVLGVVVDKTSGPHQGPSQYPFTPEESHMSRQGPRKGTFTVVGGTGKFSTTSGQGDFTITSTLPDLEAKATPESVAGKFTGKVVWPSLKLTAK
jgi:hypothetical protein